MYPNMFFALLLAVFMVAPALGHGYDSETGILSVPIHYAESGLEKLMKMGADLKLIEGIYNLHEKSANMVLRNKPQPWNDTVSLYKLFGSQYYAMVNIGKPGQQLKLSMDTDWGYSWVISKECSKFNIACALHHNKYDHSVSKTYKADGRSFNISRLIGYLSSDTMLVGQMNVTGQLFAEITNVPWFYALHAADGLIGLGFKELTTNYTPFFYNFFDQNKLKAPIFSFYINRDPTTPRGGTLFFGGIDTKHNKTAFTTLKVNSQYYWQVPVQKINVIISKKSRVEFCKNGCNTTLDTSTIVILGPAEEVREINKLLGAERILFSDRSLIPCDNVYKGPKISFVLNGREFVISAMDYIQKISYSGVTVCLSAFKPATVLEPNTWALGGAFLYNFYAAFDIEKRQVMLAEAA